MPVQLPDAEADARLAAAAADTASVVAGYRDQLVALQARVASVVSTPKRDCPP